VEPLEDRCLLNAGALDPTFGAGGKVTVPHLPTTTTGAAYAVVAQLNGKIVLAGNNSASGGGPATLVRLNTDGTPDATFGNAGQVVIPPPSATNQSGTGSFTTAQSVLIDPRTQQIVAAGWVARPFTVHTVLVSFGAVRLNPDGSLDTSFNSNGVAAIPVGLSGIIPPNVEVGFGFAGAALQPDGKVILAGYETTSNLVSPPTTTGTVLLFRLNHDGTQDTGFGAGGKVTLQFDTASQDAAGAVAVQPDGRIVVAGTSTVSSAGAQTSRFAVARLTPAGQLDPTFNGTGTQVFTFGANPQNQANALSLQADGKLVVGGSTAAARGGNTDFAVARLNPDGTLDTSFNGSGEQTVAFDLGGTDADTVNALAVQANGKVVAAGSAVTTVPGVPGVGSDPPSHFAAARFNGDGTLDTGFGAAGKVDVGFGLGGDLADVARGVAVQPSGRIVLAGKASVSGSPFTRVQEVMAVAGLVGDPGLPATVGVFDPASATWYLRNANSPGAPSVAPFRYGGPGWIPVVGDWDGNGTATIGVVDPATMTWYLKNSNAPGAPDVAPFRYGAPGWIPVVGDWTGDGRTGVGVVDPATETWYLRNSASPGAPDVAPFRYGAPGWVPVAGDWDGNGTTTIGVVDPATETWYLRNSNGPGAPDIAPFAYGAPGWIPVVGDWGGRGVSTVGVFDPAGAWYLRYGNGPGAPDVAPFRYGAGAWLPLGGRWSAPPGPDAATRAAKERGDTAALPDAGGGDPLDVVFAALGAASA
jgi:uncharacterized delta-60 repeat protein